MVNRVSSLSRYPRVDNEPVRQLNVLVTEKRHRALKRYAALTSQSMGDILSQWIDANIKDMA